MCLISPNLQSDEIIISWILRMKLGLFVAPTSSVQTSKSHIFSLDSVPVDLSEENIFFLKSPPPLNEYPFVSNTDPQWFDHVSEQGQLIKNDLISTYPLAFTDKNCNEVSYAAVIANKIIVNPGARPINRTTVVRCS